ncbi:MAG: PAS domain-containing hybrid sensor histidine kinase/response regulator [Pirellulaceae bacterium]
MSDEHKLGLSELHYRRVFEAAKDGILILNADTGAVENANAFMTELLGYAHDQFVGKHLWEIGLFRDIEQSKTAFRELQEMGYIRYEDLPLRDKHGVHREVEFVSNVYEVGDRRAIQCNIRDITERKLAEQQLAYLSAIVNASQDAIIGKNLESIITSWNVGAERLYGYTADEAIGKSIEILQPGDRPDEVPALIAKVTHGESTDNLQTVRRRKDGTLIDVSLTLSPIKDRSGQIIGLSTIARNITETVRMERQLQEQTKQLAQEVRSKDEFLAMLAHEFRNPLAPISNGIDVLRILPPSGEGAKQVLDMMEEQTHNLVRFIDDLLDVSRVTRDKMELRRQRVALTTIITNAIQTTQPLIHAKGHELTLMQTRERLYLYGDPTRLTQVVANLLNNAAKYTPQGGKLSLSTQRIGDDVAIRVTDNGLGIASDMLPRIFEMFVQADNSLCRSQGGLGIGLTLVKSLVEMHGGTVEATSDGLGKGSEFTIRLSILQPTDIVPVDAIILPAKTRSFPFRRILIVDDVGPAAQLIAALLRSCGQQARTAASGAEALAMIEQEQPDLILSDISMPEMDGYKLAQAIRRRPEWNVIRLVALTGYVQESDKKAAKEAGFNQHLVKPIRKKDLECLLCP